MKDRQRRSCARASAFVGIGAALLSAQACSSLGHAAFRDGCRATVVYRSAPYVDVGFSTRPTVRVGEGRIARCAADPTKDAIAVFRVDSVPTREAIAVKDVRGKSRILFALTLSESRQRQLTRSGLLNAGED